MRNLILLVSTFCIAMVVCIYAFKQKSLTTGPAQYSGNTFEEESKTDKPDNFLQYHRAIRTRDGETQPNYSASSKWNELQQAKNYAFARKRIGRTKSNGVIEFRERGPGNVPGRTRALYNLPGDPDNDTWLAGSATGGIWRTTDGGSNWSERSSNFPSLPISSFGADKDATIIYAGTGEYISSIFPAIGNGIFKSIDKGITWSPVSSTTNDPDFAVVTRLIVDPDDNKIIIATTMPSKIPTPNTSYIMRSIDGGENWEKVKEISGIFEQVIATPNQFDVQYASQNGVGVWKSIDGGENWALSNAGMEPTGRVEISVSYTNPNKLFASAEGVLSGTNSDLYYSSDAGTTWSLIDVKFNNAVVDFFQGQGFYDNTILCDPFNDDNVYFGGVSLFRTTLGTGSSIVDNWKINEIGTGSFLFLQNFANIQYDNQRLSVGSSKPKINVEIRFGSGLSQKAHQFFVPDGATSGVAASSYTYQNYIDVPFQVWDITDIANPKQLMVSFRDQNRNGFDLVTQQFDATLPNANSREYLYIHNLPYATTPNATVSTAGGQETNLAFNIFPALQTSATWNPNILPTSKVVIEYKGITKLLASTVTVADSRSVFDSKNQSDQVDLTAGVHPDHHFMIPIVINEVNKTFKILLANDGGVFVSKTSTTPGVTNGDWTFKGLGYNTSQFYGADKKPGADEYIGGMQDNGTRISPQGQISSASSSYTYSLGGDGFEVLWNSKDAKKIMGSIYNAQIFRTTNGGTTWQLATSGLAQNDTDFPFITKLANSKYFPDRVFTVGTKGVYVSTNFGESWKLTPISEKFATSNSSLVDVEVSRANGNIVWAGSGMSNLTNSERVLHVSTNGGQTFIQTNNYTQTPLGSITKLASHPTEQNTAYAVFSFSNAPKVLRTKDLGQSWEDISGFGTGSTSTNGFPDVAVYCLYVRPDNTDIIWAGTEIGIVESLDNGVSWTLLEDFPNVSVWDMKGQDDQVVIATHGRGIWTATIDQPQLIDYAPVLEDHGTSPQKNLVLRLNNGYDYDSIDVFIGTTKATTIKNTLSGRLDITISGLSTGNKSVYFIGYPTGSSAPYQSIAYTVNRINVLDTKTSYATYFNSISDLTVDGLTSQNFQGALNGERKNLQTNHPYSVNKNYSVLLRTPVKVSSTSSSLFYADVAIVEPEVEKDSVVLEATENGIDWIPLAPGYNAISNTVWQTAYNTNQVGTRDMLDQKEIDISNTFDAGDTLLFRLRVISGPANTGWGWALDYVSIQEEPLAAEKKETKNSLTVYPNPTSGLITLQYELQRPSDVQARVIDVFGRLITTKSFGTQQSGKHSENLELQTYQSGTYLLIIETNKGSKITKVVIEK